MDLIRLHPSTLYFTTPSHTSCTTTTTCDTISASMSLTNITTNPLAFKWKTNRQPFYTVQPASGILAPHGHLNIRVVIQPLCELDLVARADPCTALSETVRKGALRLYVLPSCSVHSLPDDLGCAGTPFVGVPVRFAFDKRDATGTILTRDSMLEGGELFAADPVLGDVPRASGSLSFRPRRKSNSDSMLVNFYDGRTKDGGRPCPKIRVCAGRRVWSWFMFKSLRCLSMPQG